MKPITKSTIALILLIATLFVGTDFVPAESEGHMATVIHKTMIPVEEENHGEARPTYVIIVWTAKEYQPLRLVGSEQEWNDVKVGDKLMIYFKDGWITDYNYSLMIQGGFEEL
jgi:hypothetical protein